MLGTHHVIVVSSKSNLQNSVLQEQDKQQLKLYIMSISYLDLV